MILSMTGFGKATRSYKTKNINVELKSLNGKTTDVRLKLSQSLGEYEMELRNLILDTVKRGKVECTLLISDSEGENVQINTAMFNKYFDTLRELEHQKNYESRDLTSAVLRLPHVISIEEGGIEPDVWKEIRSCVEEALAKLIKFRTVEGQAMSDDLINNIEVILSELEAVDQYEPERIEGLKKKMSKNLENFLGKENVDKNRFEQEVIYYLEKLDVNEEKVRLAQHCKVFLRELNNEDILSGRKLTFIGQEMGREINTLGAKAQHSNIQQIVVRMKDYLEKIKEQLANIV